jgi:hypothetical protein
MTERAEKSLCVWCPDCKTLDAPYDDLGCCHRCYCLVESRYLVGRADKDVLEALADVEDSELETALETRYMAVGTFPSVCKVLEVELAKRKAE